MATVQHANFIQYGRRAGKHRNAHVRKGSAPAALSESSNQIGPMVTAEGTDLRQIKVIPRQEWERIQSSLYAKQREDELIREAHLNRQALQAESKEIVQNWSNTIAGQRLKKLQARKLREEKEEEEKIKIDIEEAKFQAAKRKAAIEKAKTNQYYQTDRIKTFHGALLLSEVLKERDAQIELKKQKSASDIGKDAELLKFQRHQLEQGILEDHMKAKERFEFQRKIADFQKMQIKDHIDERQKEAQENMKEGEELRKLAKLHEWEQKKLEEVKRNEKMNIMKSHRDHQQNKVAIQAMEKQQEEDEDHEIRVFAAAKKRMLKLRKEKEAELFKEVMDHKDRMTSLLAAQLKKKVDDEDSRIAKANKEREEKLQREIQEKQDKLRRDLAGIAAHRNEQMKINDMKQKSEKQHNLDLLEQKMEADRIFAEKLAERNKNKKDEELRLQEFRMAQINERAEKEREKREEDLHHDNKLMQLLSIEEDQFQQYSQKVIGNAKKNGRNTYPLEKAAQAGSGGGRGPLFVGKGGVRPSYLTSDGYGIELSNCQRSTTDSIKSKCEPGDASIAKKRLGFVW